MAASTLCLLQVDRDALFVRIEVQEQTAFFRMWRISRKRALDLDYLGAVGSEQFRTVRSGNVMGEIQHRYIG
jgi:hypothetical protein